MTHASLFSGIGGFDLAAQWIGWHNAFNCEINPFCRQVLNHHFPNTISYEDITTTDFTPWHGQIDILTGGFPCQPFSLAGARKGTDDDRYLWPHMLRAIHQIRPTWVIGENVTGILTMVQPGQTTTLGHQTTLFGTDNTHEEIHRRQYIIETICRDLEQEGYTVQPFLIPACAVGAPHRRDRLWIIAHHNSHRCRHRTNQPQPITRSSTTPHNSNGSTDGHAPHSSDTRTQTMQQERQDRVLSTQPAPHPDSYGHTPRETGERTKESGRQYTSQPSQRPHTTKRTDRLSRLPQPAPHPDGQRCHSRSDHRQRRQIHPHRQRHTEENQPQRTERQHRTCPYGNHSHTPTTPNATSQQSQQPKPQQPDTRRPQQTQPRRSHSTAPAEHHIPHWNHFPTQPPVCGRDDGIPRRLDTITFPHWRTEAVKAYGNAIVPQVAYEIFKAIAETTQ